MRIAFLTTDLSYPPTDGRMLRTYNVLCRLARRHVVHLICFDQRHGVDPEARRRDAEAHLRGLCASVTVCELPSKRGRAALARTIATSLISPLPFSTYSYRSAVARERLRTLAATPEIDLVHVENTLLGEHVAHLGGGARVLVHHNVESDLFRQRAAAERNPALRAFLRLESVKMRALERRVGPRFGAHIVCSTPDADRLGSIMGIGTPFILASNGVDLDYFSACDARPPEGTGVVHVGGLNWPPNLQGVTWLVEEAWPLVRRACPSATLRLVGSAGAAPVSRWGSRDGLVIVGEVEDVRPYFAAAAVSVVPVHVSGGTRLKILNAWAMGTPVVSTTKGCEGLAARDGENLLIADTPGMFADAIIRLLRRPELQETLRVSARRLVEADYGWPRTVERVEEAYRLAMEAAAGFRRSNSGLAS